MCIGEQSFLRTYYAHYVRTTYAHMLICLVGVLGACVVFIFIVRTVLHMYVCMCVCACVICYICCMSYVICYICCMSYVICHMLSSRCAWSMYHCHCGGYVTYGIRSYALMLSSRCSSCMCRIHRMCVSGSSPSCGEASP
jgi:hypothetical protein